MKTVFNLLFISLLSFSLQASDIQPPLYVFHSLSIHNVEEEVILEWSALEEGETDYFIVERSDDTNKPYNQIGQIKATGGTEIIYLFSDANPSPKHQYRIKAMMKDGSVQPSEPLVFKS